MGDNPQGIELQDLNQDRDIENQGAPPKRLSWIRSFTFHSQRTDLTSGAASTATASSAWTRLSLNLLRWPTVSSRTSQAVTLTAIDPRTPREEFIFEITQQTLHSENLSASSEWYVSFLESKIRGAWDSLFRPVLDVVSSKEDPDEKDIANAFRLLIVVVKDLNEREFALIDIVDKLYNRNFLKDTDAERSAAKQLVFAILGWISALYCPTPRPDFGYLQIIDPLQDDQSPPEASETRRPPRYKSRVFTSYRETLEMNDQPFFLLLRSFGRKTIPEHNRELSTTPSITPSCISFHALHRVVNIKVEWVESISLHLEFDSRTRTLKLFRFPSFCILMCYNKDRSLLSQLFRDAAKGEPSRADIGDYSVEFFKEMLRSYRLIFGQDKRSHRDFNKELKGWKERWNRTPEMKKQDDPMLAAICGHGWESDVVRDIFLEIGEEDPSSHYSPSTDFPFLGKRLLNLQHYVKEHKSSSISALWHDRRDMGWWWTFWAVIIIGGFSLVLGLLQTILSIMQVSLAQKQLDQGGGGMG